ncbi:MAG: ABC transporter permease [Thermomicrobiales bacterium]
MSHTEIPESTVNETGSASPRRSRRKFPIPGALALAISAIQLLFMFCLSYPPLHAAPQHIPFGLVGPDAAIQQIETQLEAAGADAFDIHHYANADEARQAIEHRDIYGAVVVAQDGPTMLVSSAANPAIATMFRTEASHIAPSGPVPVEDVVPASGDDPNGSGFLATVLPLTLLSLALGVSVGLLEKRPLRTMGWIALASSNTAIFAGWITNAMGIFTADYWGTVAVLVLLVFGVATTSAGLTQLGTGGRVLDLCFALLLLCVGIPGAGALVPHLLLVEPWREIGPLLPPGAAVDALHGLNFFDGAATTGSLWVLAAWIVVGPAIMLPSILWTQRQPR